MTFPPDHAPARADPPTAERDRLILSSMLGKDSMNRLANIKMVDPERYRKLEACLVEMYFKGASQISDDKVVSLLKAEGGESKAGGTVTYSRRSGYLDLD